MKKFSLLLMIVLIVGAIFVSCSAEPALSSDVATVALSLDTAKELQVYTVIENLPAADKLYWFYTATKRNGGFTTGQTGETLTPIRADKDPEDSTKMHKGLPGVIGYDGTTNSGTWFSTGDWTFSFYGYNENNVLVYQKEGYDLTVVAATQANSIGATASITLELENDPRSGSTFEIDGVVSVKLGTAYDSGASYKLKAYVDGVVVKDGEADMTIAGGVGDEAGEVTFTAAKKTLKTFASPDNQLHHVEFKMYKDSDTATVYASGEIGLIARMGYTYKIYGELDSLESRAQVGINATLPENLDSANQTITELTISNEKQLRAFASYVNQGNNCAGMTITLTKDITLTQPWTPIGNSYRGQEDGAYFAGTFDGRKPDDSGNYTISGLTDGNNYVPANAKPNKEYSYGLFGIVKNATIKNIDLTNVDIKSNNASYTADEVGAVVGYSLGSLTLDNITVSGSVVGDSVGGIIGRAYGTSANATIVISNCTNQAAVSSSHIHDSGANSYTDRAAGIAGYINGLGTPVTVENCINRGNITVGSANAVGTNYIAGICCYGFKTGVVDSYTFTNNKSIGNLTILGTTGVTHVASIVFMCNEPKEANDTYSFTDASNYEVGTITVFGTTRTDVPKETH